MDYPRALLIIFAVPSALLFAVWGFHRLRRRQLLRRLAVQPFPEAYRDHLNRTVHYPRLDDLSRHSIERAVLRFIHTKHFEGVRLALNDEMRVIIAFYACYVTAARPEYDYPTMSYVYVYDHDFVVGMDHMDGGIMHHEDAAVMGQATGDAIVLSWPLVQEHACHDIGENVIIHECAHILDPIDGAPLTVPTETELDTMGDAFEAFCASDSTLLNDNAAENDAEFFAYVTELYFLRPERMRREMPKLFAVWKRWFDKVSRSTMSDHTL